MNVDGTLERAWTLKRYTSDIAINPRCRSRERSGYSCLLTV